MGEALSGLKRSLMCGEVRESNVSQKITLMGWVQRNRKLGGLQFIDLRDRTGIMQIVFGEEINAEAFEKAKDVRPEYCIAVTGEVVLREAPNHNMPTGLVISIPNLKSGLSDPYFSIASLNVILFIGSLTSTPATSLNT